MDGLGYLRLGYEAFTRSIGIFYIAPGAIEYHYNPSLKLIRPKDSGFRMAD